MKKHFPLFLSVFIFLSQSVSAMPLIFKADKEVKSANAPEIISLDTSKYNQIRISAIMLSPLSGKDEGWLDISAVEIDQTMPLFSFVFTETTLKRMSVIEAVPSKIQFTMKSPGKYKIYVWGM